MSKYLLLLYIDNHAKLLVPYKVILHKFQLIALHYLLVDTFLNHLHMELNNQIIYCLNENLYELFQHYEYLKVPLQFVINNKFLMHNQYNFRIDLNNSSNFHYYNNIKPSYNL